jgi:transcriptional regulator with XRE-family HTH domain
MDEETLLTAARLKRCREYLGFTQAEAAAHAGISRETLGHIECGQRRAKAVTVMRLAYLYGRPVSYLMGQSGEPELSEELAALASGLPQEDVRELREFAAYLQHKRNKEVMS